VTNPAKLKRHQERAGKTCVENDEEMNAPMVFLEKNGKNQAF
jgi:hypothetical protein